MKGKINFRVTLTVQHDEQRFEIRLARDAYLPDGEFNKRNRGDGESGGG